jgi:hypothetical protein
MESWDVTRECPKKKSWRYTLNVLKSDMCIVCISEFNIFRHI